MAASVVKAALLIKQSNCPYEVLKYLKKFLISVSFDKSILYFFFFDFKSVFKLLSAPHIISVSLSLANFSKKYFPKMPLAPINIIFFFFHQVLV